jgi:hypothetical protein
VAKRETRKEKALCYHEHTRLMFRKLKGEEKKHKEVSLHIRDSSAERKSNGQIK